MAEVSGVSGRAAVQAAVEDEAGADAGGDHQAQGVAVGAGGAAPVLGGGHRDGVPAEDDGQVADGGVLGGFGAQREAAPAGEVDGADGAGGDVDGARASDAEGPYVLPGGQAGQVVEDVVDGGHQRVPVAVGGSEDLEPVQQGAVGVDQAARDLGPADVEGRDQRSCGWAARC